MAVREFASVLLLALSSGAVLADSLIFKDGRSLEAPVFRREGESIIAVAEVPGPDGKPMKAERSIPLSDIARVESVPPAIIKDAATRLADGDAAALLPEVEAAVSAAEPLGSFAGSYWPDLLILKAHLLIALGKKADAEIVAAKLGQHVDPGVVAGAQAISVLNKALGTSRETALAPARELLRGRGNPETKASTIAAASIACGLALLEKDPRAALKSFLELPVFLPNETALSSIALLGAAQSYLAIADYNRAIASLEELIKTYPKAPESSKAKTLLPEWQRRRTIAEESKSTN